MSDFEEVKASAQSLSGRKLVFGVGTNDADYNVRMSVDGVMRRCPFHAKWTSMLARCYSTNYQKNQPTYKGASVCTEWLTFSTFRGWMEQQDWEGLALDKDLLVPGNKEYGPHTCTFVTSAINNLLTKCSKSSSGLTFIKESCTWRARFVSEGKSVHLGMYKREEDAREAYRKGKARVVKEAAGKQVCPKLSEALYKYASHLISGGYVVG